MIILIILYFRISTRRITIKIYLGIPKPHFLYTDTKKHISMDIDTVAQLNLYSMGIQYILYQYKNKNGLKLIENIGDIIMKQHIALTMDGDHLDKFDKYLHTVGLTRSGYFNEIMIKDVSCLNFLIDGKTNPVEIKQTIVNYFRGG